MTEFIKHTVDRIGIHRWKRGKTAHRLDGPAVIYPNGDEYWYKDGLWHRDDGPAIVYANGKVRWFLEGIEYSLIDYTYAQFKDKPEATLFQLKWA